MEYIQKLLKKTGWISILTSVIFALLGLILICKPEETVTVIAYIIGISFILMGILKIINYMQNKGNYDLYNYDLIYGILAIVIGMVAIIYISTIGTIFRIIIGIWIIYSATVRTSSSLKLRKLNTNVWIYSLILSILMFICGLYIILNSGAIIVTIGIIMMVYSIIDIIESIIFIKNLK